MKRILFIALAFLLLNGCTKAEKIATMTPTQTAVPTQPPTDIPTSTAKPMLTATSEPNPSAAICADVTEIPQIECEALVALAKQIDDTSSLPPNPCDWSYVQCTAQHVTALDLSNNQLSRLPPEIGNLMNLAELNLRHKELSSLPLEIGNLDNLTILYLYSKELRTLPSEMGNLANLTILSLANNELLSLPLEMGNLANLAELYLYSNELNNLPQELCKAFPTGIEVSLASFCTSSNSPMPVDTAVIGQSANGNEIIVTKLGTGETAVIPDRNLCTPSVITHCL